MVFFHIYNIVMQKNITFKDYLNSLIRVIYINCYPNKLNC